MLYGITLSVVCRYLHEKERVSEHKEEALETENVRVRKPLVTSKKYTMVTGQANELHQSHKTSIKHGTEKKKSLIKWFIIVTSV